MCTLLCGDTFSSQPDECKHTVVNQMPGCLPPKLLALVRARLAVCLGLPGAASIDVRNLQVFCRIDYHLATPAIAALARTEEIYKTIKFSDHAPITVDYDLSI